ncbi:amino acid adenylation domain-containing protein [Microtetraspora fusca]|uniref:Amino acid adenylation domain-containing protein n=1 Tax=Microtetraspora fusca TaxID=1997 RepID=A0ABW6V046_MICFU
MSNPDGLSDVKRRLLARLAAGSAGAGGPVGPPATRVPRRQGTDPVRLSYAQERVWLMDRLAGELPLFNLVIAGRVRMDVDLAEMRRRLAEIVARHDAMRMSVAEIDGEPVMRIAPAVPVEIPLVDLSRADPAAAERLAFERAYETGMRPYRLDVAPLWRVELLRLGDGDHVLVIAAHHIAVDGTSLTLILRELAGFEAAPELLVGYADYAVWQRERMESGGFDAELDYWRDRLAGLEPLELPADRLRPARPTYVGDSLHVAMDPELARRLVEVGRAAGATPYMTVMAVFCVLLHRYTGARDIGFGSLVSGRTEPELHNVIGMFANMVVVRADLSGDPDFRAVVGRVKEALLGAMKHQNVPFERLVQELRPDHDRSAPPLVRVAYNMPAETTALPRIGESVPLDITRHGSQLDLTLHMIEEAGTFRLTFEYATDLYDRETVRRMSDHFLRLAAGVADDPGRPVARIAMAPPGEERALRSFEEGPVRGGRTPLHVLVAEQARRTPDAVAVLRGGRRITYAELDADAEALAGRLRACGVVPETPVAVCLGRVPYLPAALLGVWKAGGAYVPLDPGHPRDRLEAVLDDTGIEVVVTSRELAGVIPGGPRRLVLVDELEDLDLDGTDMPCGRADAAVHADNAAYVMYTSGSTGRPKGVVITHGGIANRVMWTVRRHGFGPGDRVLQKTPLTFDAAGWEFFAPLVSGGAVVLPEDGVERDPAAIVRAVGDHGVTVLQVVPALLRLLVDEPGWERCGALRLLFCAGEPLHAELCRRVRALTDVEICNTYGPTECAIDVTAHEVQDEEGPVPIGAPIDDTRVLVLAGGQRAPLGVPGELLVGGVGVARCYLNRPGATAERFVPDPYGPPGARLYRTGDVARWNPRGELEFLGRTDDQVKINGVRVEPGEVEAALAAHPAVRAAVVTVQRMPTGTARLVAHITTRSPVTPARIRDDLRERLPDTLIPSAVVEVADFPRTSSGKIDRQALAALPVREEAGRSASPMTATEEVVAGVWRGLLGVPDVGPEDDFFQLGGHSLLVARLAARLGAATGRQVELPELFGAMTVRAQARYLESRARPAQPPLARIAADGPVPLSFGQRRLWFLDRLSPGSPEYVVPLIVRLPGGGLPGTDVRARLRALALRHDALRTRYAAGEGEPYAIVDDEARVAYEEAEAGSRDQVAELVAARLARGFDLERGPVWRALGIRLPGGDGLLLLTVHHIACDARSLEIIARDLHTEGTGVGSEPPVGYADFADWQRRALTGEHLDRLLGFWRERLDGLAPFDLPADRPRPPVRDPRGAMLAFEVSREIGTPLLDLGRRAGATPFMTMFAAFCVFLARHTGRTDLAVGVPVDGRDRPELDDVVGFFVNTLVLRADLGGDPSFADLLDRVRERTLDALAHRDLPFERLVDELRPERDLARTPIVGVLFDLQTGDDPGVAADDDMLSAWRTAKADLTLMARLLPDGTLSCRFEYATALFERATVERFAARFARLLEGLHGDLPVSRAELLDEGERLLTERRGRGASVPEPPACLHDLVAAQARRTPDAVAVTAPGTAGLRYRDLVARAARLAARLRAAGVGRGDVVGVCLERGPDLVVALLATLHAGAAYLPLDPADPRERLAWLVADTDAAAVITDAGDLFPSAVPTVSPKEPPETSYGEAAPPEKTDPRDLAYVIYTSGSTGTPKGVMIEHAAIVNRVRWMQRAYGLRPGHRVLQKTPFTFDVSVWEFFWPLTTGATLVMAPPGLHRDALGLAALAEAEGVTHLHFVPSMLDTFLAVGARLPASVREVFCSGEALGAATVRRFREVSSARLHNLYGPTELSVDVTFHEVDGPHPAPADVPAGVFGTVPIGVPIDNAHAVVVDRAGERVPVGVAGELLAGGAGVARGYVNRPGLTADRFVPDPYGPPGARLYRTGDVVRWTASGDLEFLGRADDQAKIRGVRVEPGEVAAVAATHPGVREAVVVADGDRLVGYYVPERGEPPGEGELARHCGRRLPAFMLPVAWIALDRMPLGRNGKLDRRALPAYRPVPAAGDGRPSTAAEKRVAAVWAELLGVEPGAHDDFFALGGHSLLAVRAQHRLAEEFDVDVPLRVLFEATTVARLAEAVEAELEAQIAGLSDAEVESLLSQGARDDA